MSTYRVLIEAEIEARNFDSAQRKLADLEERIKRAQVHAAHISLRSEKK